MLIESLMQMSKKEPLDACVVSHHQIGDCDRAKQSAYSLTCLIIRSYSAGVSVFMNRINCCQSQPVEKKKSQVFQMSEFRLGLALWSNFSPMVLANSLYLWVGGSPHSLVYARLTTISDIEIMRMTRPNVLPVSILSPVAWFESGWCWDLNDSGWNEMNRLFSRQFFLYLSLSF